MIKVLIAGGTGWAGSELARGVISHPEMELVGATSRLQAGNNLGDFLGISDVQVPVFGDISEALESVDFDVLVEYTKPASAKNNILAALEKGKRVVVGTSGLTDQDYQEIELAAIQNQSSVLAVGNFALTVVLLQKFSEMAAKYIPNFEIIDYAHEDKVDSPSGTARELAFRLGQVQRPNEFISEKELVGIKETCGGELNGVRIHSLRLPGHVIGIESIFGLQDEKLTIRHDSGSSAKPYVNGALLAIEKVNTFQGLKRGLDSVMDFEI